MSVDDEKPTDSSPPPEQADKKYDEAVDRVMNIILPDSEAPNEPGPADSGILTLPPAIHSHLTEERAILAKRLRIRIAGCHIDGDQGSDNLKKRDARTISILDSVLVVPPDSVRRHVERFNRAYKLVDGDPLMIRQMLEKESGGQDETFFEIGGQAYGLDVQAVQRSLHDGYALILEYEPEESGPRSRMRVPVGYHIGFRGMPSNDRYPTLSPESLRGVDLEVHRWRARAKDTLISWRTGVLLKMTETIRDEFAKIGITVPVTMIGMNFRRLGWSTATKAIAIGAAGLDYVMCNIGKIRSMTDTGVVIGSSVSMPNGPSVGANAPLFCHQPDILRRKHNALLSQGNIKAGMFWEIFAMESDFAYEKARDDADGVLLAKGGIDLKKVDGAEMQLKKHFKRN